MNSQINEKPLVSIVVITYKSAKYVLETLEGAYNQTYQNIELIISDDCSPDNTIEICRNWIDKNKKRFIRTELLISANNTGVTSNCNRGISLAEGKYISLCAGDDFYHPNKIQKQVELFEKLPNDFGIVYGDLNIIDENSKITHNSFYNIHLKGIPPPNGDIFKYFFKLNPVHTLSVLVKKEVFEKVGKYDENLIFEDWDMSMRWAKYFKFHFHNDIVASYRKHTGQFIDTFWTNKEKYAKVLETLFTLYSKHDDYRVYKKQINKSQLRIFLIQITRKTLTKKDKIKRAYYLLKNNISFLNAVTYILVIMNIDFVLFNIVNKVFQISKKKNVEII